MDSEYLILGLNWHAWTTIVIMVGMVLLSAFKVLPLLTCCFIAALMMLITRCGEYPYLHSIVPPLMAGIPWCKTLPKMAGNLTKYHLPTIN